MRSLIVLVVVLGCGKGSKKSESESQPKQVEKPKLEVKVRPRAGQAILDVTTIPGGKLTYFRRDDLKTKKHEEAMKHAVADANGKARLVVPSIESYLNKETLVMVQVGNANPPPGSSTPVDFNYVEVKWTVDDPITPITLERPSNATGREVLAGGTLADGEDKIYTCPKAVRCMADVTPDGHISFDLVDKSATSIIVNDKPVTIENGRAHVVLDYGEKIATSELATGPGNPPRNISIAVKITDDEGHWAGDIQLSPSEVLFVMMNLATPGPLALPGDTPASAKRTTGLFLWPDGKISDWVGTGKRPVDVDVLFMIAPGPTRTFSPCKYQGGHTVQRAAQDSLVRVRDRRTGKELATHTVPAKVSECAQYIRASSPDVQKDVENVSRREVIAWAAKWLAK